MVQFITLCVHLCQKVQSLEHTLRGRSRVRKNAVFDIFDQKLRKAMYKTRQTFYGLLFTFHMSTNPESFVRIHWRVFATGSSKVAEISKICFGSPKNLGDGGLTLPHRRVGSTTEILRVHGAPLYFTPSIFREFFKNVKNLTIFWGGIVQALGWNLKKWVRVFSS